MTQVDQIFDVAIIGAGLAGLRCAQQLQQQGYHIVILEKSRGLGGRLATRRMDNIPIDHGLSYFFEQGESSQKLIEQLSQNHLIQGFSPQVYQLATKLEKITTENYYFSVQGMTSIAKYLAQGLNIWRNCRVINLVPTQGKYWHLNCETPEDYPNFLKAKTVISAIPAPQLLLLLTASHFENLPSFFWESLKQVQYHPCLTVMAGYTDLNWQELGWDKVKILSHSDLASVSVESVKRETNSSSIFVLHSTPYYAEQFLDSPDLQSYGRHLLNQASQLLYSPLKNPSWYQVHRWRYAIPHQSIPVSCLTTKTPLPLVACGDWCSINPDFKASWHIEKALISGLAAANHIN